jgi:hypothetical protein
MNQYLILIRGTNDPHLTPDDAQKRMAVFGEWVQKVLNGRYVAGAPLDDKQGRLIKSKNEVLTDGPFLESKEMISGYVIISSNDLAEATELTKQCPLLAQYQLEVRLLKPMGQ